MKAVTPRVLPFPRLVAADGDEGAFGHRGTVVEDHAADPDAEHAPEQVLEGGAVEDLDVVQGGHLAAAFVPPEGRVVDRAESRLQLAEAQDEPLDQHPV